MSYSGVSILTGSDTMTTVWEVRNSYDQETPNGGEGGHLLVEEVGISRAGNIDYAFRTYGRNY